MKTYATCNASTLASAAAQQRPEPDADLAALDPRRLGLVRWADRMGLAEFEFLVVNMTEALVAPDPHFDCVHMLSEVHWTKLRDQVATHPPDWREALAYVLSQGPTFEALPLLSTLLRDAHAAVARQAALSLVDLTDLEPGFVIPEGDLEVMRQIATSTTDHLDDLRTFLTDTKA